MMVWKTLLATFRKVKRNDLAADDTFTWRYWQKLQFIAKFIAKPAKSEKQPKNDSKIKLGRVIKDKIFLTAEKDEALISACKDRPILWDRSHPDYKNIVQRAYAFDQVAKILSDDHHKYSRVKVGFIWRSLLSTFYVFLKKIESNGGASDTVTWQHWHKQPASAGTQKSRSSQEDFRKGSQDYVLFTSEQKEAFIDAIRERQIIWGFMPRNFEEFQERRAAYNEVAEILSNDKSKYTGPEMQYLWHNLRSSFQHMLKKVIANEGDDSKITWIYWKKLKFIEEYERTKINIRMPEEASSLNSKNAGEEEGEEEQINEPSTSDNYHHDSQKEKDFVNNLNSMTVDLSNFAIFPDEVEKGVKKLDSHAHIKTRSSTCNNDNILSINTSPNLANSNNSSSSQIDEWKKKSRHFTNCAHTDTCDPFGLFEANEENICFSCLEIRADLRKKAILMWDGEQLEQQLCDYAYFHAIKIFNPNAEYQFANSKSQHPYFLSYKNIRQQVKIILKNLSSLFNFPSEMTNAAKRAFMKQTKNNQNALRISTYCKILYRLWMSRGLKKKSDEDFQDFLWIGVRGENKIEFRITRDLHASVISNFSLIFLLNFKICCEKVTFTTCVLTFEGNKYRNNFELIENDDPKPNNFIVCFRHAKLFCIYYRLLHMDWNIHWNCYLRISQIQKRLPNLNDSNVINAIDPQIFMYISKEYFSLFKMLDERLYDGSDGNKKSFSYGVTDSLLEGFYSWDKFNDYIKDMGILKRIEEEK
ncbi:unnamed protein product [Meloidogyne enterolobii]|uniref:Uncharacterized protein n=1 Tax=Meloidogyne enterolobii TaxID=390850 RepID=A0ACB0ZSN8_MELEN